MYMQMMKLDFDQLHLLHDKLQALEVADGENSTRRRSLARSLAFAGR